MQEQMPRLSQLKKENEKQKRHFIYLTQRLNQIKGKMGELKEIDQKLRVMMNLETADERSPIGGIGGSGPSSLQANYPTTKEPQNQVRQMHHSLDKLSNEIAMLRNDKATLHDLLEIQKRTLASTPSIWPTRGWLSSRFGYRNSPFSSEREFHRGIDISTRMNAPIVAPADGVVFGVDWDDGFGKTLVIKHGNGLTTLYAHLNKILVKRGKSVKRGEKIGLVGTTGRSTGSHLHYEVFLNGVPVDPLRYVVN